jgi:hypothetical protein
LTGDLLPTLDHVDMTVNPCLRFADLADYVVDFIPVRERVRTRPFVQGVARLVGRIVIVNDAVSCAYETDRLAIAIYQDQRVLWSLAVVAIVRGRLDAFAETAICFLTRRPQTIVSAGGGTTSVPLQQGPKAGFCLDSASRRRGGQDYTVIWLGSSDRMCSGLAATIGSDSPSPGTTTTGTALTGTVRGTPYVYVRSGTSVGAPVVGRASYGTVGVVSCYSDGQTIYGGWAAANNHWDKTTITDLSGRTVTGYIADVNLDTGGDITTQVKRC